ncbi:MAG: DUF6783 domain-containing protein [Ruminococcus sp.]
MSTNCDAHLAESLFQTSLRNDFHRLASDRFVL